MVTLLFVGTCTAAMAQEGWLEEDYQRCACAGLETEVLLPSGARADCVSDTRAIEIESYRDWAEGIGQALHYASETGLSAMLIMFCEDAEHVCYRQSLRLQSTIATFDLPIAVKEVELGCAP